MITLKNVTKTYKMGGKTVEALKDVSLTIGDGEAVVVMGPSGSGKSTLLQLMGALDSASSGTVQFDSQDIKKLSDSKRSKFRRSTIGFVFQQFYLQPFLNALDNVALPMRLNGTKPHDARARALELLQKVGLGEKAHRRPNQLSGGEMQRIAIARALANKPKLLLADEPTGNLDRTNADEVVEIFKRLADDGTSVVIVTHDEKVGSAFPRVIRLENGVIEKELNNEYATQFRY